MRSFRKLREQTYFRCDLGPNSFRCDEALGGANLCLLQVLQAAAGYLGFSDIDCGAGQDIRTNPIIWTRRG
jgi:hypothetical protein